VLPLASREGVLAKEGSFDGLLRSGESKPVITLNPCLFRSGRSLTGLLAPPNDLFFSTFF